MKAFFLCCAFSVNLFGDICLLQHSYKHSSDQRFKVIQALFSAVNSLQSLMMFICLMHHNCKHSSKWQFKVIQAFFSAVHFLWIFSDICLMQHNYKHSSGWWLKSKAGLFLCCEFSRLKCRNNKQVELNWFCLVKQAYELNTGLFTVAGCSIFQM